MFRFKKGYSISIFSSGQTSGDSDTGQNEYILFVHTRGVGNKCRFYGCYCHLLRFFFLDSEMKAFPRWALVPRKHFLYSVPFFPETDSWFHEEAPTLYFSEEPLTWPFLNYRHGPTGFKIVLSISEVIFNGGKGEMYGKRMPSFLLFLKFKDFISRCFSLFTGF